MIQYLKLNSTLEAMDNRQNDPGEHRNGPQERVMELTQPEQQTERQQNKNEWDIWGLWGNVKCASIHVVGVLEGEGGVKSVFKEIMAENFSNVKKETDIQVQEAHKVPNKMNPIKPTPTYH